MMNASYNIPTQKYVAQSCVLIFLHNTTNLVQYRHRQYWQDIQIYREESNNIDGNWIQ